MNEETHYKVASTSSGGGLGENQPITFPTYKLCEFPVKNNFTMAQFSDPKLKVTCEVCLAYKDILPAQHQPWEENKMNNRISLDRDLYSNKFILFSVLLGAFIFPGILFFIAYAHLYLMHWFVGSVLGVMFWAVGYESKKEELK